MVARDNLNDNELVELKRRVAKLEAGAGTGFTSITRGALRVASEEGLIVEGSAFVTGEITLIGTFTVDGNGRIIVGGTMELVPEADGGALLFPNGKLRSTGSAVGLQFGLEQSPPASVTMNGDGAYLNGPGGGFRAEDRPYIDGYRETAVAPEVAYLGVVRGTGELVMLPSGTGGPGPGGGGDGTLQWPFSPSTVSSEFGPRPSPGPGGSTNHLGIDLAPGAGQSIPAAGAGTVTLAGWNGGYGNCVMIDHGNGIETLYGHMQEMPPVSVGQAVTQGQTIGAVGNTGNSFGAHLHFEVHVNGTPVNPRTKLPAE